MPSHGPTLIIDRCESAHHLPRVASLGDSSVGTQRTTSLERDESDEEERLLRPRLRNSHESGNNYGSARSRNASTLSATVPSESIRFQVVVWDVGPVDVALGRVPMTFRVTMFWEDEETISGNDCEEERAPRTVWTMEGRRKAYQRLLCDETITRSLDVPPVSLMNVVTFDVIGQPEVCVLREEHQTLTKVLDGKQHTKTRRLMRWTSLYKATLLQHNMRLDTFPHDEHVLSLKLGILVHRRAGSRWDMNQYALDLATEGDSQHSTRIPHGLIVDHARVPDFTYNQDEGLDFQFVPLSMGVGASSNLQRKAGGRQDCCLEVSLRVARDSGYYDQNIMPLIVLLNIVAIVIPISMESSYFFQRGLLLLNITFVQIGIRMNVDKHLPSVGYQIKMQRIMNQFFFSLLFLVLESSLVYVLYDRHGWAVEVTDKIDMVVSGISLTHILATCCGFYWDKKQLQKRLKHGSLPTYNMRGKDASYLPV